MGEPVSERYRRAMNTIAAVLDDHFNGDERPKKTAFVLLIAPFDEPEGRVNYISNGERKDIVVLMKEVLARFEGQPELKGTA